MQTIKDFVTNPVSGISQIDDTVTPYPEYMITGVAAPVAQLAFAPTIDDVTKCAWTPWHYLYRRRATVLTR